MKGSVPAISAALLSALLFGASTPFAKILLTGIGPWLLAGLLYLGAGFGPVPPVTRSGRFTSVLRDCGDILVRQHIELFPSRFTASIRVRGRVLRRIRLSTFFWGAMPGLLSTTVLALPLSGPSTDSSLWFLLHRAS